MSKLHILTAVSLSLLLTGCGTAQSSTDTAEQSAAETSEVPAAAETASPAETAPAETAAPEPPAYDYVHGEDGYFSLIDEGLGTPVKVQESGTCWVVSATTAMESNALVTRGETIEVDPYKLLHACYNPDRSKNNTDFLFGFYMRFKERFLLF